MLKAILHISLIIYVLHITYLANPGSSYFSFHPFCMALAYGLLMTEGILTITHHGFLRRMTWKTVVLSHWIINSIAGVLAIFGFIAIYQHKNNKGSDHFISYHGIFGLITCCYTIIQLLGGLMAKYPHFLKKWIGIRNVRMMHSCSGVISYSLAIITIFLSFYTTWFEKYSSLFIGYMYMTLFAIITVYIVRATIKKYMALRIT